MPTYDYECTKCGHRFELFQKMTDPPRRRCPKCRGAVRRLIGAGAGLIFKGSGFHITDYRSKDYREKANADTGSGTGDAKKDAKEANPEKAAPPVKKEPRTSSKNAKES